MMHVQEKLGVAFCICGLAVLTSGVPLLHEFPEQHADSQEVNRLRHHKQVVVVLDHKP